MDMKITQGDLEPSIVVTCYDDTTPVNIAGADGVTLVAVLYPLDSCTGRYSKTGTVLFRREATGSAEGVVTVPWELGDTATAGRVEFEVEVMWPTNRPQTFPISNGVVINPTIG